MAEPKVTKRSIKDYRPAEINPNKGTVRGVPAIVDSLSFNGAGRSILVDRDGEAIAGSHTIQAAMDAGFTDVYEIETDGKTLIAVKRTDLDLTTDAKARALQIADNRTTILGYDQDNELVAQMLIDIAAEDVARLMCGEKAQTVVTSPPYNQNLETFKPSGMQKENPNFVNRMASAYYDSMPEEDYQRQQLEILEMLPQFMTPNGSIFYNHKIRYRDKQIVSPLMWLSKLSYPVRQEIIWDRGGSITLNARMFMPSDERIYWLRVGDDFLFNDTTEIKSWSTIWNIAAKNDVSVSAAFATDIALRCIQSSTHVNDIVLEPFNGSGTTLVACEQTQRRGYGMEIEPKYCAVTLERLAGMGLEPQLLDL